MSLLRFYRKKPIVIRAVVWDGSQETLREVSAHCPCDLLIDALTAELIIPTLEGTMRARIGDYVVVGIQGELYPVKPDIFQATYEVAG